MADFTSEASYGLSKNGPLFKGLAAVVPVGLKRKSEHKQRPPRKQTDDDRLAVKPQANGAGGGGGTTQRSNLLSNQSKPTSYGAGSGSTINSVTKTANTQNNNLLGKSTLSGMLGGNDHIWKSSRGGALNASQKGVRSETGSNHNVSTNNHPYQDS